MIPNTMTVFNGKINNNSPVEESDLVDVNSIDNFITALWKIQDYK